MFTFTHCKTCGELNVQICGESCSNAETKVLRANTSDGATEKHVPEVTRNGNHIHVVVGSIPHPMTEEHLISMIAVEQGETLQVRRLSAKDAPEADFEVQDGPVTVYEFCNLHGLWKAEA